PRGIFGRSPMRCLLSWPQTIGVAHLFLVYGQRTAVRRNQSCHRRVPCCRRKEDVVERSFEEVGVTIDGIAYGHFTGEVQFGPDGSAEIIDFERSGFHGRPLRLDLESLLSERASLRNKHGMAFMADYPDDEVRSHRRRF